MVKRRTCVSCGVYGVLKTIDLCKEKGVALYMIPDKIGRGFYNH